jgi:hypothetical protein
MAGVEKRSFDSPDESRTVSQRHRVPVRDVVDHIDAWLGRRCRHRGEEASDAEDGDDPRHELFGE